MTGKTILISTFGSYGDLHPYIAIGHALLEHGHRVIVATSRGYEAKIRAHGLDFHAVRPDVSLDDKALVAYVMDRQKGSERIVRAVAETVRDTYADLLPVARRADVLVTHPLTAAAVAIAEQYRIPWISSVLAPISFLSAYDPPAPAPVPWIVHARALGVPVMRAIWSMAKRESRRWTRPILDFRRELGLSTEKSPLFEGQHSPAVVLALFSALLGEPQPDWPPQTLVTGFPFFDAHHEQEELPEAVSRFLEDGPPPLIFTLGSSAVSAAGRFFVESLEATQRLGCRALLLTGRDPQGLPAKLPSGVAVAPYARHSAVFPRAAAIIHQGGVGTTAQAMRAGRPMLVVPFSHDQPDNANRVARLGIARVLPQWKYDADRAAAQLRVLLETPRFAENAARVAAQVRREEGAAVAAGAILKFVS